MRIDRRALFCLFPLAALGRSREERLGREFVESLDRLGRSPFAGIDSDEEAFRRSIEEAPPVSTEELQRAFAELDAQLDAGVRRLQLTGLGLGA